MLQEVSVAKPIFIAMVLIFVFPLFLQAESTCPVPPDIKTVIDSYYDAPELSIAVSPVQPHNVVVIAANYEAGSPDFQHVRLSEDYGATWEDITGDMMPDEVVIGSRWMDPSVAIDLNNRLYVCYMDEYYNQYINYSDNYLNLGPGEQASWTTIHFASGTDKEHIWVDNGANSPNAGNLYAAWTGPGYTIEFTRQTNSENLGDNITTLYTLPDLDHSVFGVNVNTGPNGEIYVVWLLRENPRDEYGTPLYIKGKALCFTRSLDGGDSFDPVKVIVDDFWGVKYDNLGTGLKLNSYPSMAVNPESGKIFAVYSSRGLPNPNGTGTEDAYIYMISSSDRGDTWTPPDTVNPDDNKHHWFSWISCDPVTRWLSCVYYGWDYNSSPNAADVYVALSFDDGSRWTECRVNDDAHRLNPNNYIHCDYIGIASYNKRIIPAWNIGHDDGESRDNAEALVTPFTIDTYGCCVGMRGDANNDNLINVGDIVFIVNYYQHGGPVPFCWDEADVNDDGEVDLIDANYLINYIFKGGPPPLDCP
jgi:hypothetical protein